MSRIVFTVIAFITLVAVAPAARADVIGVYAGKGAGQTNMTVEYRDKDNFRIDMGEGGALMSKGQFYMVMKQGGREMAVDMKKMAQMMSMAGKSGKMSPPEVPTVTVKSLGRSEQVAGIDGEVYQLTSKWPSGRTVSEEAVLCDDERVVQLQQAMVEMSRQMQTMMQALGRGGQNNSFENLGEYRDKGLLRYGNELRLTSLKEAAIPDSRFKVPPQR